MERGVDFLSVARECTVKDAILWAGYGPFGVWIVAGAISGREEGPK